MPYRYGYGINPPSQTAGAMKAKKEKDDLYEGTQYNQHRVRTALDNMGSDARANYNYLQQQITEIGADPALIKMRDSLLKELGLQLNDPFSVMAREAALSQIRGATQQRRKMTFVTGPRGLEGPAANAFMGGGTSLLGS